MTFRSVSQKQDEKGSVRHAACTTTAVNCSYATKVTIYNCRKVDYSISLGETTTISRAVQYLVREQGIRQFLDIGAGLPTVDNTH